MKEYNNLTIENLLKTNMFNSEQKEEILEGLKSNLDVSIYAKTEIDGFDMSRIREKLLLKKNTTK